MSTHQEKPKRNWRNIAIVISSLIIIVLLSTMIILSYRTMAINKQLVHLIDANQTEIAQLKTTVSDLQTNTQTAQTKSNTLAEKLNTLQKNFDEYSQSEQDKKDQLTHEEANYYLKLAQFNLIYRTNISQALRLLELADQTLSTLSGSDITTLREALAKDMANLQSIPIVDIDGIYARLSAMPEEIKQLRLMNPSSVPADNSQKLTQSLTWWEKGLQHTWNNLKQLIIIRHTTSEQLLILPNLRTILYQNLNACVTNAIWALLQGEQDIYLGSLNQMSDYLNQYFMADDIMTKALQTQISHLKEMPIKQSAPTLSVMSLIENAR